MASTVFNYLSNVKYVLNQYAFKQLSKDRVLVTTKHGSWLILTDKEFALLKKNQITQDPFLMKELHDSGVIITSENFKDVCEVQRKKCQSLSTGIQLHIISPTIRCTNSCLYCHVPSRPKSCKEFDMDEDTAKETVDFIMQCPSDNIHIEFQGGEPTLNFSIVQFIHEYAEEKSKVFNKKIRYNMVSNFQAMDEDIAGYIIKNKFGINTSLDGPKELHDKNRGTGSYEKVILWTEYFLKRNLHSISALPTITKSSLEMYEEIVDEYIKLGFRKIFLRYINQTGSAKKNWKKIGYSPEEYILFWKKALDHILNLNKSGVVFEESYTKLILNNLINNNIQGFTCFGSPCGSALIQCAYNYNGDVYACDESRSLEIFRLGNVKENTLKEVFTSPDALNIITISSGLYNKCDSCVWHPYCGTCVVNTYATQGTLHSKIPVDFDCKVRSQAIEYVLNKITLDNPDKKILLNWYSNHIF